MCAAVGPPPMRPLTTKVCLQLERIQNVHSTVGGLPGAWHSASIYCVWAASPDLSCNLKQMCSHWYICFAPCLFACPTAQWRKWRPDNADASVWDLKQTNRRQGSYLPNLRNWFAKLSSVYILFRVSVRQSDRKWRVEINGTDAFCVKSVQHVSAGCTKLLGQLLTQH